MSKRKILLIDDEVDFLEIMAQRIEAWGYEVIGAQSGSEGIEAVENDKPNIVILDYMLPDMDGIAVLKKIRKINKKIPVIMLTAHPDIKSMKASDELKVSAYIPKLSIYSDVQTTLKTAIDMIEKEWDKKGV